MPIRDVMLRGSKLVDVGRANVGFPFGVQHAAKAAQVDQRDVHGGIDAVVCVEETDGTCRRLWP